MTDVYVVYHEYYHLDTQLEKDLWSAHSTEEAAEAATKMLKIKHPLYCFYVETVPFKE